MTNSCRKILVFTLGFVGGAERMALTIAKLLPKEKYNVRFVLLGKERDILDFMPKEYEVDIMSFSTKSPFSVVKLWWKIKKEKPDVVFGTQARINPYVIVAARLARVKVLVRSSGMIESYKGLKYFLVKNTLSIADRIIAQQEQMKQQIADVCHVNPEKIVTLHNLLDFENIDLKIREQSPFDNNENVNYVNVARISPGKAQDALIKAFSIVRQSIPLAHLYFIGPLNDKQKEYYQNLTNLSKELNVENFVHFIGYDNNPYRWVKHSDCFVFPSRMEGLPNALIEASYIGVPCVATKCLDIICDIIKDGYNGYTVEVDDIAGLADGMISAIKLSDFKMVYHPSKKEDFIKVFETL